MEFNSEIDVSLILKFKDSFLRRFPPHSEQLSFVTKSSINSLVFPALNFLVLLIKPTTPS